MPTKEIDYNWKGKTLLLIEDDHTTCILIGEFLSNTNINLLVTDNMKEALKLFEKHRVDISVIDIHLQGENGFDIASQIRKMDPFANILIQTALIEAEVLKKCNEHGYSNFINKPYTYSNFLKAVDKCLKKQKSIQHLQLCN
jgi:DNA-binding NtrC family response regulator